MYLQKEESQMNEPSVELLIQRILRQEARSVGRSAASAFTQFASPSPGSVGFLDRQWASSQNNVLVQGLFDMTSVGIGELLGTMGEYVRAIGELLESQHALDLPIMSCARSLHETALIICWLTDPDITPSTRFGRVVAFHMGSAQGAVPVVDTMPMPDNLRATEKKRLIGERDKCIHMLQSLGFEVKINQNDGQAQNVRYGDGKVANIALKTTELAALYTPDISWAWTVNSGATHSKPWLARSLEGARSSTLFQAAYPLLDISNVLCQSLLGYVGQSADEAHRATRTRRIALIQAVERDYDTPSGESFFQAKAA